MRRFFYGIADEVIIGTNPEIPAVTDALKTASCEQLGKKLESYSYPKRSNKLRCQLLMFANA
jgi:septum formation inhibitor-activating ATPase MinD